MFWLSYRTPYVAWTPSPDLHSQLLLLLPPRKDVKIVAVALSSKRILYNVGK